MTNRRVPASFLLTTWEGGGSVPPFQVLARKLLARGHRVRVMSDACNRESFEAIGARFTPWTRAPSRPDRRRDSELLRDWEPADPLDGLRHTLDHLWMGPALAYAEDVLAELEREPADLVVSCEMLFGVAAGCLSVRQPHVLMAGNISLYPIAGVPPLGPGLPPARTQADHALHDEITRGNIAAFDHGLPALNAARAALGLAPLVHALDQVEESGLMLLATSRSFDFAPDRLPSHIRYVGPQERLDGPDWTSPWPADDRRPLVLVSFSTTFQNHVGVLQRVLDAAGPLPVRVLLTHGEAVQAHELTAPPNARLVERGPHAAIMREAALVVTHGGHGTVMKALMRERPMLVIPHGRDQNDNAVRVTERGAGLSLPPAASTDDIRASLQRLLADPAFATAARALGSQVRREAEESPLVGLLEDLARAPAQALLCA